MMTHQILPLIPLPFVSFPFCSCRGAYTNPENRVKNPEIDVLKSITEQPAFEFGDTANEAIGELRTAVWDQHPVDAPAGKSVQFKEVWRRRGDHNFTFIVHKSTGNREVYDVFKWHKDIVF